MVSEDHLAGIMSRWERTTPGPWTSFLEKRDNYSGSDFIQTDGEDIELRGGTPDDQEFVAHAKQDIPLLVDEVRRLRGLLTDAGLRF